MHNYVIDIRIRDVFHENDNITLMNVLREENMSDFMGKDESLSRYFVHWDCPLTWMKSLILRDKFET